MMRFVEIVEVINHSNWREFRIRETRTGFTYLYSEHDLRLGIRRGTFKVLNLMDYAELIGD